MPALRKSVKDSKATVVKNEGGVLVLRVFGTGFGNEKHRDFHGEFFTTNTDFSDDIYEVKGVNYDHLPPEWAANPFASRELKSQPIGRAKLVEVTEEGRWYEVELMKAKEYHEYFLKLADQGFLGASTQCMPGGRTSLPNGEITHWAETAIALTVQPSNADTLDKIHAIAKSTGMPLMEAIEQSLHDKAMEDAMAAAEEDEEDTPVDDAPAEEEDTPVATTVQVEFDSEGLVETIKAAAVQAVQEALAEPLALINEVTKSLDMAAKTISTLTDDEEFKTFVSGFAENLAKTNRHLKAATFTVARASEVAGGKIFGKHQPNENDADETDREEPPAPPVRRVKSALPDGFPGRA